MDLLMTGASGPHLEMMALTAPLLQRYAALHGADYREVPLASEGRPPSWGKVPALQAALGEGYQRVLWIDVDVVILNGDRSLFAEHRSGTWQLLTIHHVPIGPVPNCGVWLVTPAMLPILQVAWEKTQYINHGWWEQAAVMEEMGFTVNPPIKRVRATELGERTTYVGNEWNQHAAYLNAAQGGLGAPVTGPIGLKTVSPPAPPASPPCDSAQPFFQHWSLPLWGSRMEGIRRDVALSNLATQ